MKKRYYIEHDNPAFSDRIKYVFDFIENHPLAGGKVAFVFEQAANSMSLIYAQNWINATENSFYIPAQNLLFSKNSHEIPICCNKYSHNEFALYGVERSSETYHRTPVRWMVYPAEQEFVGTFQMKNETLPFFSDGQFGFDIIESIFFHISRFEEHFCSENQKDIHGRMFSKEQFLVRNNICKIPIVDHLVYCFLNAIGGGPELLPSRKRLTYDIDVWQKYTWKPPIRSTFKYAIYRPNLKSLIKLWQVYLLTLFRKSKDPYHTFDWLLEPSEKMEQVIYFLMGGRSKFDKPVPVINDYFKEIVGLAKQKGIKVGVHPSYESWDSIEIMRREKERLEGLLDGIVTYSRQHFLHFSFETTPGILEKLGIKEDSTMGYSDRIGFRCGTGFPYKLYNFKEELPYNFLEVPLVVMDVGLLREAGNNSQKVTEIWDDFMEQNRFLTQLTFNFHNSRFFDAELEGVDLYKIFNSLFDY